MKTEDLKKHWPNYCSSHHLAYVELSRIASAASGVAEAESIWEDEDWWRWKSEEVL